MGLEIKDISFSYGKNRVLENLSLNVDDGEIYALLGGSGSGKTTLLSVIAGFLEPQSGSIILNGKDITRTRIEKRGIGVVFQDYALFPHMTVSSNIQYPMEVRGFRVKDRSRKEKDLLSLVGMDGYGKRYPSELSGGEKQRVSLARTLASDPSLILLDEPMSALDASLRDGLRREIRRILKDSGIPSIHVTHDQMEAVSISDRMGLLHDGKMIEEGSPDELYSRPHYLETARFMGFRNIFRVDGIKAGFLKTDIGVVPWDLKVPDMIAFRSRSPNLTRDGILFKGKIISRENRGDRISTMVNINGFRIEVDLGPDAVIEPGKMISFWVPPGMMIPIFR